MKKNLGLLLVLSVLVLSGQTVTFAQSATADDDEVDARANAATISTRLGSKDPLVRQRAAEALAKLAAVDQKKLIEGYRLQEKDRKVRLALDWALYRIGKSNALYQIVLELDSSRHDQAVSYLGQLDSPVPLHSLLKRDDNQPKITVGIIEALGQIGDNESLELIKAYRDSFFPGVSGAAERATDQIEKRLAQVENPLQTRPRTVSTTEKPLP
jgi:HEAT repeat protein